ncbi:MAG TPA: hypothetical protein VF737_09330 [Gemmatimonadaceae bacterium]
MGAPGVAASPAGILAGGWVEAYRLYDVGYAIDLERAAALAGADVAGRLAVGAQASTLHIPVRPLLLNLGPVSLPGAEAQLTARLYDFGVIALRARIRPLGERMAWAEFVAFARDAGLAIRDADPFDAALRSLTARLAAAIVRARVAAVNEDYTVYRVTGLWERDGTRAAPALLDDARLSALLLQEDVPLSASAMRELLPARHSYYPDDLVIPTWDAALVVSPEPGDETDVEWILEFANAQLLELRYYDAVLDAALPRLRDDVARVRRGFRALLSPQYGRVLGRLYELFADTTETVERVENALRVTQDVYLARVYAAAMDVFRARGWRASIDRKLGIIRETYAMLNAEAQARRNELLEATIVVLIVIEIGLAFVR